MTYLNNSENPHLIRVLVKRVKNSPHPKVDRKDRIYGLKTRSRSPYAYTRGMKELTV